MDWDGADTENTIRLQSVRVCAPTKTWDGEGSHEDFDTDNSEVLAVGMTLHEANPIMVFDADDDVEIGDLIQVPA